jgi:hypothetical protein
MSPTKAAPQTGLGRSTLYREIRARAIRVLLAYVWNRFCDDPIVVPGTPRDSLIAGSFIYQKQLPRRRLGEGNEF